MSSFICSQNHFKKLREETYYFFKCEKYARYRINLNYDSDDKTLINKIDNEIYNLIKNNVASVNLQYKDNEQVSNYTSFFDEEIKEHSYYKMSIERMISLYNAYKCVNYQIELDYNRNFLENVMSALSDRIVKYLIENKEDYNLNNFNEWEYE